MCQKEHHVTLARKTDKNTLRSMVRKLKYTALWSNQQVQEMHKHREKNMSPFCIWDEWPHSESRCEPMRPWPGSITLQLVGFHKSTALPQGFISCSFQLYVHSKTCYLHPIGDIEMQGSWAVRDPVSPDLSRWTCERLKLSVEWLAEENDTLSKLCCCHRGLSNFSATSTGVWI